MFMFGFMFMFMFILMFMLLLMFMFMFILVHWQWFWLLVELGFDRLVSRVREHRSFSVFANDSSERFWPLVHSGVPLAPSGFDR